MKNRVESSKDKEVATKYEQVFINYAGNGKKAAKLSKKQKKS